MNLCFELSMLQFADDGSSRKIDGKEVHAMVMQDKGDLELSRRFRELDGRWFACRMDDSYAAMVSCRTVNRKEARAIMKLSKGFRGYEWMAESIIENDRIIERKEAE